MASLATSGGGAHGDSSFDKWIHSDTAGAEARVAFSQTGSRATTRVTNDVGAFPRNHANGRAQGTNEGSVSSTHCVSPLLLQTTRHTKLLPVVQLRSGVILLMGDPKRPALPYRLDVTQRGGGFLRAPRPTEHLTLLRPFPKW